MDSNKNSIIGAISTKKPLKRSPNSCSAIGRQNSDNFPIHVFPVWGLTINAHSSAFLDSVLIKSLDVKNEVRVVLGVIQEVRAILGVSRLVKWLISYDIDV